MIFISVKNIFLIIKLELLDYYLRKLFLVIQLKNNNNEIYKVSK